MSYFSNASAKQFGQLAACLLASRGRLSGAVDAAEIGQASADVRRALKSIGLLSELSGTPFYQDEARAFLETMRGFSAFDQLASMAHQVPMRRRIAALAAVIEGDTPDETATKALATLDLTDDQLPLLKAVALCAMSAEMAAALTESGVNFLLDQLRSALGPATDARFFAAILAGITPTPATGTDATAFRNDVAAALSRLNLGQNSRPCIIASANQTATLNCLENSDGSAAFPEMSWQGGVACGLPVFPSDGLPLDDSGSPGAAQLAVIDCQGLAVDPGEVILTPASEGVLTIEGQDYSLWQKNLNALRAERWVGAAVARTGAVQLISGSYGPSETSP